MVVVRPAPPRPSLLPRRRARPGPRRGAARACARNSSVSVLVLGCSMPCCCIGACCCDTAHVPPPQWSPRTCACGRQQTWAARCRCVCAVQQRRLCACTCAHVHGRSAGMPGCRATRAVATPPNLRPRVQKARVAYNVANNLAPIDHAAMIHRLYAINHMTPVSAEWTSALCVRVACEDLCAQVAITTHAPSCRRRLLCCSLEGPTGATQQVGRACCRTRASPLLHHPCPCLHLCLHHLCPSLRAPPGKAPSYPTLSVLPTATDHWQRDKTLFYSPVSCTSSMAPHMFPGTLRQARPPARHAALCTPAGPDSTVCRSMACACRRRAVTWRARACFEPRPCCPQGMLLYFTPMQKEIALESMVMSEAKKDEQVGACWRCPS